jgi:hypothetical protein
VTFKVKDRVVVVGVGRGWVRSVRLDDRGEPIYSISLEDQSKTLDGWFVARDCELVPDDGLAKVGGR